MRTITHRRTYVAVTGCETFAQIMPDELDYVIGQLPPRYPVPTTIGIVENDGYYIDILGCPDYGANLDIIKYHWKYADHEKVIPVLAWFARTPED